ncbi:sulfite exporter TauE/SafE family protein [Beggiatoa alba]|nr:sulfite exporter TauE/SafE family protein [Beggiatoa alba]
MHESTIAFLSLGFGLGLLHALDADHIMAVSTLASGSRTGSRTGSIGACQRSRRQTLRFCCQWAIGHGGILLLLAALVLFAGVTIPEQVSQLAEKAVGVILMGLGCWIFWLLYQNRIQLHIHSHKGLTHMHLSGQQSGRIIRHDHRPVLVGITHGLAGSAPVLAIVPVAQSDQGLFALIYIIMFSFGIVSTMLVFGLFLSKIQDKLAHYSHRLFDISRLLLATLSVGFGGYWLFAA